MKEIFGASYHIGCLNLPGIRMIKFMKITINEYTNSPYRFADIVCHKCDKKSKKKRDNTNVNAVFTFGAGFQVISHDILDKVVNSNL